MPRLSAAILLYRHAQEGLEVLLVHPGGPFWARRDEGAWSLPKGEHEAGADTLAEALREFGEELGRPAPATAWTDLGTVRQKGGKVVQAWAGEGDLDVTEIQSSVFRTQWPPGSGQFRTFPEVDRAGWFAMEEARAKLLEAQREFLDRLLDAVGSR